LAINRSGGKSLAGSRGGSRGGSPAFGRPAGGLAGRSCAAGVSPSGSSARETSTLRPMNRPQIRTAAPPAVAAPAKEIADAVWQNDKRLDCLEDYKNKRRLRDSGSHPLGAAALADDLSCVPRKPATKDCELPAEMSTSAVEKKHQERTVIPSHESRVTENQPWACSI
jgi:hypothetical protein